MRKRKRKKDRRYFKIILAFLVVLLLGSVVCITEIMKRKSEWKNPEELLTEYMNHISQKEYGKMYEMLDVAASGNITREEFKKRNSAIYEGIEIQNMKVEITSYDEKQKVVHYQTSFDTVAGNISFENKACFLEGEDGYKLAWNDDLIFPELQSTDKVKVSTTQAERGKILDRNDKILAGKGVASSVGIIPGKMQEKETSIQKIAEILEIEPQTIEKKLSAKWVKEDSFVPIKTIPKVSEIELLSLNPDEMVLQEKERQDRLLEVPGVMISDIEIRQYPFGKAAAHLVGYVQSVTAEDLEKHSGEGYASNSLIGKSGMEGLFEKELKGHNGCKIYIVNVEGRVTKELAEVFVEHGQDIKLTIDATVQNALYEQFKEDKSCSVAINQYTGEVLALVSTPAYDNNDFILGMSNEKWTALNEDEKNLYIIGSGRFGVRVRHLSQLQQRLDCSRRRLIRRRTMGMSEKAGKRILHGGLTM